MHFLIYFTENFRIRKLGLRGIKEWAKVTKLGRGGGEIVI